MQAARRSGSLLGTYVPAFHVLAVRARTVLLLGDPKYKLLPLDPMDIEEVKVVVGGEGGLMVLLRNVRISGIKDTKIEMTK
jgi:hypothetical protein